MYYIQTNYQIIQSMQILDPFYLITSLIVIIGLSILTYIKFGLDPPEVFNVTIIGSKVDSILLAYQLIKLGQPSLNITVVGDYDSQLLSYADSTIQNDKLNMASLSSPYIDRRIMNFCGTEPLLMQLLEDSLLQYKIKRSQTLYNQGTSNLLDEDYTDHTYSLDKQRNLFDSMINYGLSHLTATFIFKRFQKHLQYGIDYKSMDLKSVRSILNQIMSEPQKPISNGITYMSQVIGLDQRYIKDYINPIISSSYFTNVNSVAVIFKLLPLYCSNLQTKTRNKNWAILLDERVLAAKLLIRLHQYKNLQIRNLNISSFQETLGKTMKINFTDWNSSSENTPPNVYETQSNMVFVLQDFIEENQKQISYYRVIVDGLLPNDDQYQQVYTMHFQHSAVSSITRLCAVDCKGFKNNAYLAISKTRLAEKDLTMFSQHQIVSSKKIWAARSQLPSPALKFQQTKHFYRVIDTQLVSDSYEMKLIIYKSIAEMVRKQMHSTAR